MLIDELKKSQSHGAPVEPTGAPPVGHQPIAEPKQPAPPSFGWPNGADTRPKRPSPPPGSPQQKVDSREKLANELAQLEKEISQLKGTGGSPSDAIQKLASLELRKAELMGRMTAADVDYTKTMNQKIDDSRPSLKPVDFSSRGPDL